MKIPYIDLPKRVKELENALHGDQMRDMSFEADFRNWQLDDASLIDDASHRIAALQFAVEGLDTRVAAIERVLASYAATGARMRDMVRLASAVHLLAEHLGVDINLDTATITRKKKLNENAPKKRVGGPGRKRGKLGK